MNRLFSILIITLALALPTLADTVSGTASTSSPSLSFTTSDGMSFNLPSISYVSPISVDPQTGNFSFSFGISQNPLWNDFCNPINLSHCTGAEFYGVLSGTLNALPVYNGTFWVIPDQTLTLHSYANISYEYTLSNGTIVQTDVKNVLTLFSLAVAGEVFATGGLASTGVVSFTATFPDPTPEPATMILAFTGAGILWNKRRRA